MKTARTPWLIFRGGIPLESRFPVGAREIIRRHRKWTGQRRRSCADPVISKKQGGKECNPLEGSFDMTASKLDEERRLRDGLKSPPSHTGAKACTEGRLGKPVVKPKLPAERESHVDRRKKLVG